MEINEYISSGIIEMYVMGLCSTEEKTELEMLRKKHPQLQHAILQFEMELEEKMLQHTTLPSAETDEKILQQLYTTATPVISFTKEKKAFKISSGWRYAAAAAILLLAISSYYNFTLFSKTNTQQQALNELKAKENETLPSLPLADYNIMKDPAITPVAMYGVGYHAICRCTMFWDKKTGKMYIMIHHLPLSSASKDYQLWAMVNGKPVSVGIIKDEIRGRFIEMPNVPATAIAFIVTLENAGGTAVPTMEETYLSGKI